MVYHNFNGNYSLYRLIIWVLILNQQHKTLLWKEIKVFLSTNGVVSTAIRVDWRKQLIDSIQEVADELMILTPLKIESFRNDDLNIDGIIKYK